MANRTRVHLAALSGLCTLAGCTHYRNESLALHDSILLEALGPPHAGVALTSQTPSVTKIDRSDWEPNPILVPVDGTAHYPTYVRVQSRVERTRRQRGEYPTELSALELGGETENAQQEEALFEPVFAAGNVLLMPIRMIFYRRPWETLQSPREAYERYWIRPGTQPGTVITATAPQP